MKKYKLYLFDFDGTLCDTTKALRMVFKESYKAFGYEVSDEDCVIFSREPLNDSWKRISGSMDHFWDFVDVINHYLNGEESVKMSILYDDVKKLHEDFSKNNVQFGIVTSNNIPHCKDIYRYNNVDISKMCILVGNQECQTPKPSPLPIQTALKMLNYQGDLKDVVYVGDSLNDAKAAVNAGVYPILLDRDNIYHDTGYEVIHSLIELL